MNKFLLYRTGNYTHYLIINHNGKEHTHTYIYNWITLLHTSNTQNTVNQLYCSKKEACKLIEKAPSIALSVPSANREWKEGGIKLARSHWGESDKGRDHSWSGHSPSKKTEISKDKYCTAPLICGIWKIWQTSEYKTQRSHGRRSLVGCDPWGRKESDTTERLHFYSSLSCIGEGNGTHSSVLAWRIPWTEKPGRLQSMGSQSWTWLKRLSSSMYICNANN